MSLPPTDPAPKEKPTLVKAGPISLSLMLHVALMLIVGGAVVVERVIPKSSFQPTLLGESFDQAIPSDEMPEEEMEEPSSGEALDLPTDSVAMPETSAVESSIDAIAVDSPMSSNPWMINAGTSTGAPTIGTVKSGGGGSGSGTSGTGKPRVGNIFGKQIEASKLGVILDVSGSAHPHLTAALKEIDKNFDNSPTVLAMGCGMNDVSKSKVDVEVYGKIKPDKEKDKPGSRTSLGQLANGEAKIKDLGKYLDRLKKRDDVWAIQGGDIFATHLGFEKLIAEGCDTIYWFADFADAINAKVLEDVLKELKRKNIKVIAHNFTGKPVRPEGVRMAKETGGDTISKIP